MSSFRKSGSGHVPALEQPAQIHLCSGLACVNADSPLLQLSVKIVEMLGAQVGYSDVTNRRFNALHEGTVEIHGRVLNQLIALFQIYHIVCIL